MEPTRFRRPAMPGGSMFESLPGGDDPATRAETGARIARLLVSRCRTSDDEAVVERIVALADEHGLDLVADLWHHAPPESLAGALWRLYILRAGVRADPVQTSREFDAGRHHAPVAEVVAGVVEPPGPTEVVHLADTVLRGVVVGDVPVTLERAAAFARVVALGRVHLGGDPRSAARLVTTSEQLEAAAHHEREGTTG
jgi:hypothetical protein